jgi:uncharacterized protein YbjT (DUF2867 family)
VTPSGDGSLRKTSQLSSPPSLWRVDPPDIITFGGPEAISRNEALAIAEQATGRTIKVQRMPRALARLGMRVLDRPNPAMATIFGTGLMRDLLRVTWDDAPLRERGITPRSASD